MMEEITEILSGTLLDYSNLVGHSDDMYKLDRMKQRLEWLKQNTEGPILEIGCATGYVLNYVCGQGTGIDINRERLKVAKTRNRIHSYFLADAEHIDFPDKSYKTVILSEVLEHMPFEKSKRVLNEALRIGYVLLVTLPKAEGEEGRNKNPEHYWLATEDLVKQLFSNIKILERIDTEDFIFLKLC